MCKCQCAEVEACLVSYGERQGPVQSGQVEGVWSGKKGPEALGVGSVLQALTDRVTGSGFL